MTDRAIRTSEDLDAIDFGKGDGLVPVVAQHAATGGLLMLGYADRGALEATLATGQVHFRSRSRGTLWRKGETSGHTLDLFSLHTDCDGDAVLALVRPAGPTCHTGEESCFGDGVEPTGTRADDVAVLRLLDRTLAERAAERPAGSYTTRLLDDANLRLKKLGEETAELVTALAQRDARGATEEAADLLYHVLVALRAEGVPLEALLDVLRRRAS